MATRLIALLLLAGSLLPVANLLPGGEEDPEYLARMLDWLNGLALCLGVGALAMYIAWVRRRQTADSARIPASDNTRGDRGFAALAVLGAFVLYAMIAQWVFSGRPLLIDEIVQVLQARWYADGQLWVPTPVNREFFSIVNLVDLGDRVFGQFPAGGPAMLAIGSLVGAEWLVGPTAGAVSVGLFWIFLGDAEPDAPSRWRRGTTILFALAPFAAFMFGSHMNHATTLLWLLLAIVALTRAVRSPESSPWWGLLTGAALGMAATIRPMDGAAFALPAAVWLLWRSRRGGRPLASLLLSGVGIAIPLGALLWVNAQTTGDPLLFGYDLLWGSGHSLGFHATPWGAAHSPVRGVELISIYLTRLSVYLFELPFPALLLVAGGLWLQPKPSRLDRYLLASAALLLTGYWAYWFDGFFRGPRFLFPLLPALILWSARFPKLLAQRLGSTSLSWLGVRTALVVGVAMAVVTLATVRVPSYRNELQSMRFDIERESARAGVRQALVLVKESWGARLIVRMWNVGISRSNAEIFYQDVDACQLELALNQIEQAGNHGAAAMGWLLPLLADSASVIKSTRSPDDTERMLPGYPYAPVCGAQIESDWRGFAHLAPFRLARDGNVYARWIPGREAEIAAQYPERPVYMLSRNGISPDATLRWERLTFRATP